MPSAREIAYALYGAWRLLRLDRGAMVYFDRTVEGFWKSFFAAVLVAPGQAILLAVLLADSEFGASPVALVVVLVCGYVISWTAFPVVVHPLAQAIGRAPEYTGFIVALNWSQVIQIAIYLPVVLLIEIGLLPKPALHLVWILLLGYEWFVTRVAFDVSGLGATGLVLLNLVLGFVIARITEGMLV